MSLLRETLEKSGRDEKKGSFLTKLTISKILQKIEPNLKLNNWKKSQKRLELIPKS